MVGEQVSWSSPVIPTTVEDIGRLVENKKRLWETNCLILYSAALSSFLKTAGGTV